ncbi:MAG: acyltransferase [Deltaproteobacteria bacterium]|nr:acyltransferase [Deltaproteobacteria bacterium]
MTRPARLDALTSIRFFAALHVVLYHAQCSLWASLPPAVERLRDHGDAAVALFYVLSGFILTYTYAPTAAQVASPKQFWLARLARIGPLYWLAFAACVAFRLHVGGDIVSNLRGFLASATMLQAWTPTAIYGWNTPGWSLSVEAFFYLLFPLLLPAIARCRSQRALLACLVGLWLAGLGLREFGLAQRLDWRLHSIDVWPVILNHNPLFRLPEFAIGIVAARLFALQPAVTAWAADGLVAAGAAVSLGVTALWPGLPRDLLHNTLFAPAFAALILGLAWRGRLARALELPWLVRLGEASFALYIVQEPVMNFWYLAIDEPHHRAHPPWVIAGQVLAVLLVSLLAWRWVETPAQRLIRRFGEARLDFRTRWPAWPWRLAAVVGLVAAAFVLNWAREGRSGAPSAIGRELVRVRVGAVAYDLAHHDEAFLLRTMAAHPRLQVYGFDSGRGDVPQQPWVIAGRDWPAPNRRPHLGETGRPLVLFAPKAANGQERR